MTDLLPIISDRSRCATSEHCERKRWWQYEYEGTGLEKAGNWLDPLIGTAVHEGIERYLGGTSINSSVAHARETMLAAQREGPIQVFRPGPDPLVDWNEAMALVEVTVRGWIASRGARLLADYTVLATERECQVEFTVAGRVVRFLCRPDIELRRNADGARFIMNLKTASRVDQKWREKWRYDMQTFTEMMAVEASIEEPVNVSGTIMVGLIKGSRKDYPIGSGNYHWESPLLWPWKRDGQSLMPDDWAPRYEWSCVGPHKMTRGSCPGGRNHRLSGYHKANVALEYPGGVPAWIEWLADNDPEFLDNQFVELTPILRSPYEMEQWKRQTLPREIEIRERRDHINSLAVDDPTRQDLLDKWFPMSTSDGSCVWPSACPFLDVCWGQAGNDLEAAGFRPRTPNHPEFVTEE